MKKRRLACGGILLLFLLALLPGTGRYDRHIEDEVSEAEETSAQDIESQSGLEKSEEENTPLEEFPEFIREHIFYPCIEAGWSGEDTLLSAEELEGGIEYTYLHVTDEDEEVCSVRIEEVESLPQFETTEEYRDFLLEKYPGLRECSIRSRVDAEDAVSAEARWFMKGLRQAETGEYSTYLLTRDHARFYVSYQGKTYLITENASAGDWEVGERISRRLGYQYYGDCIYERDEVGNTAWMNGLDREHLYFEYRQDTGLEEPFFFRMHTVNVEDGEFLGENNMEVEVFREGEGEPFQTFQVSTAQFQVNQIFRFEDLNADGILDFTVMDYYGANGGTAFHYLYVPSRGCFAEGPKELEYFGSYYTNPYTRETYLHIHGSAIAGEETTYIWVNETEVERVKYFVHDTAYDEEDPGGMQVHVIVSSFDKGRERVLMDCLYESEEYDAVWEKLFAFYYLHILWEGSVEDADTGESYRVYYGQDEYEKDAEDTEVANDEDMKGIDTVVDEAIDVYQDRLYVIDEDTRLAAAIEWDGAGKYKEVAMTDIDGDGQMEIVVTYEDESQRIVESEELLEAGSTGIGSED